MILVGSRVRGRGFYCSATSSKFTVHDTVKFGTVMFYKDYIGNASAGYVITILKDLHFFLKVETPSQKHHNIAYNDRK